MMDIHAILKQLPHRYPFLLVDRVIELRGDEYFDLGIRYEDYLASETRLARVGKTA